MKKLAFVLMAAGALIILYIAGGTLYTLYQNNKLMEQWLQDSTDPYQYEQATGTDAESAFMGLGESFTGEHASNTSAPGQDDHETVRPSDTDVESAEASTGSPKTRTSSDTSASPAVKQNVLGVIVIDKIKIKYPIVEGVQKENLRTAIGHIPGTAPLGQPGNCALAGHRNYTFGRYFNRLDELDSGDEITIKTKQKDYVYKVYEKLVVVPNDVSVIKGGEDDRILTLITCTPLYIGTHRLIIHARLENPPDDTTPSPAPEAQVQQTTEKTSPDDIKESQPTTTSELLPENPDLTESVTDQ